MLLGDALKIISIFVIVFYYIIKVFLTIFLKIFQYPVIIDFLTSVYLVGYELCYKMYNVETNYCIVWAVVAGILTAFIVAKLKYFRLIPLISYGVLWGYLFFLFGQTAIKIPKHEDLSYGLSVMMGVVYLFWHIYSGVKYRGIFGDLYDPIGYIISLIFRKKSSDVERKAYYVSGSTTDEELEEIFNEIKSEEILENDDAS